MYLRKGWSDERCRRIARFRLGNEMGEGRYWEAEEGRRCRVCGGEGTEWWKRVLDRCVDGREEGRGQGGWGGGKRNTGPGG